MSWQLEVPLQWRLGFMCHFEWWFFFFGNIGPGVGIRILDLVLLTCVFCPVQAVPSRDLPMSVPREHEGGFRHLPALSSMCCLPTVRMAILSNGIWLLVVILISITPVILRDAEHLGLWPSGFFFSLFFLSFLKGCEEDWPLKLASWT